MEAEKQGIENLNIFQYTPKAMAESDIVVPYFTKAVNGEISIDDALQWLRRIWKYSLEMLTIEKEAENNEKS